MSVRVIGWTIARAKTKKKLLGIMENAVVLLFGWLVGGNTARVYSRILTKRKEGRTRTRARIGKFLRVLPPGGPPLLFQQESPSARVRAVLSS